MSEWANLAIKKQDALTELLRESSKHKIAIGTCEPDSDPLGQVMEVVEMPPVQVGIKSFVPETRVVGSSDGDIYFFQGGLGEKVLYEDAKKLFKGPKLGQLTHSLKQVTERKRTKLTNVTKS